MARRPDLRKPAKSRPNPLDAPGITYIDYKDTDLLSRFVSDRGRWRRGGLRPRPGSAAEPRGRRCTPARQAGAAPRRWPG
ncbi:hypothetical protein [Streptomyces sp. 2RAF24]|uniref:hypothetical protein n=1 Tax=Streptomyces sp. 2RAF24 TaxID=3232997 RepID=UPI003F9A894B